MFKINDLYVSLGSPRGISDPGQGGGACYNPPQGQPPIVVGTTDGCTTGHLVITFHGTPGLGGGETFGFGGFDSLKGFLKAAIEKADFGKETTADIQKPQTLADVEMLEGKLKGALDELGARKTELLKKIA